MSPALHTPAQIASFIDGDPRLIAAAYRDRPPGSPLYVLRDGHATRVRDWAKATLMCPIPECPAPDLTVVARYPRRRDGFRHGKGAGNHAPESVHHLQGKAVVAEWLTGILGDDAVKMESASDTQRSRVADVMATLPSGQRVAFEIQYASLSVAQWRERHDSYLAQGIVDVWLWGHTRFKPAPGLNTEGRFELSDVFMEVCDEGLPLLFINPTLARVGVAVERDRGDTVLPFGTSALPYIMSLEHCGVDETGLTSKALRRLAETTSLRRVRLEDEAREQEDQKRHLLMSLAPMFARAAPVIEREERAREARRVAREREREEQRRARARERARREEDNARRRQQAAADLSATGRRTQCIYCGMKLADIFEVQGFHNMCAQKRQPPRSGRALW